MSRKLKKALELLKENGYDIDTLSYNEGQNNLSELQLESLLLSEGSYQLKLVSENIFPELLEIELNSDILLNIDLKWKGIVFHDDFDNLGNWENQGGWALNEGRLMTQNTDFYNIFNHLMFFINKN